jgi:hypothetical protein
MSTTAILKSSEFELVSEFAQPDAKKRLSLGEASHGATAYNIYRNPLGQLILDPVKTSQRYLKFAPTGRLSDDLVVWTRTQEGDRWRHSQGCLATCCSLYTTVLTGL